MKYDRNILVDYLKNIYQLEFTKNVLSRQFNELDREYKDNTAFIASVKHENKVHVERRIASTGDVGGSEIAISICKGIAAGIVVTTVLAIILAFCGASTGYVPLIIIIPPIIFSLLFISSSKSSVQYEYDINYRKALAAEKEQQRRIEYAEKLSGEIYDLCTKRKNIELELKEASETLDNFYALNIIPIQYRDIYSAFYLYQFFSTSRSDDLDMVIQTLLLDNIQKELLQIHRKVDFLLDNVVSIKQELENIHRDALENYSQCVELIEKQNYSIDEQNDLLAMIESNSKANAYFSLANYLKYY